MYCQPSFEKVVAPSFLELGLASLVSVYSELCELGKPPHIIDATALQENPEVWSVLFINLILQEAFPSPSLYVFIYFLKIVMYHYILMWFWKMQVT